METYPTIVGWFMAEGHTLTESIKLAEKLAPAKHQAFIEQFNDNIVDAEFVEDRPYFNNFNDAVKHYQANGLSRSESYRKTIRAYPDLHNAFIDQSQRDY